MISNHRRPGQSRARNRRSVRRPVITPARSARTIEEPWRPGGDRRQRTAVSENCR